MILNEMFTGQAPHGTGYKTIGRVSSEYEYLDDLITNMLRQSPEERFATIEDIYKIQPSGSMFSKDSAEPLPYSLNLSRLILIYFFLLFSLGRKFSITQTSDLAGCSLAVKAMCLPSGLTLRIDKWDMDRPAF